MSSVSQLISYTRRLNHAPVCVTVRCDWPWLTIDMRGVILLINNPCHLIGRPDRYICFADVHHAPPKRPNLTYVVCGVPPLSSYRLFSLAGYTETKSILWVTIVPIMSVPRKDVSVGIPTMYGTIWMVNKHDNCNAQFRSEVTMVNVNTQCNGRNRRPMTNAWALLHFSTCKNSIRDFGSFPWCLQIMRWSLR